MGMPAREVKQAKIVSSADSDFVSQMMNGLLYQGWELYGKLTVTDIGGKPYFSLIMVLR